MKIGLSFSRCIRDIIQEKVNIDDVLIIISRTDFNPKDDKQWKEIWRGYGGGDGPTMSLWSQPEWYDYGDEDEDRFRSVTIELYENGKLHQPRQFGAYPPRRQEYWLETVLPSEELERNPAAKKAWDHFQVVAGLTKVKLDTDYQ